MQSAAIEGPHGGFPGTTFERESLLKKLNSAIRGLLIESGDITNFSFTFDNPSALNLISSIECVVNCGLKDDGNHRFTFWEYIRNIANSIPGGDKVIEYYLQRIEWKTTKLLGRAFICNSLNQKELASLLSSLLWDRNLTLKYYEEESILGNENDFSTFLMILESLNYFNFKLNVHSPEIELILQDQPRSSPNHELIAQAEAQKKKLEEEKQKKQHQLELERLEKERLLKIEEEKWSIVNAEYIPPESDKPEEIIIEHKKRRKKPKKKHATRSNQDVVVNTADLADESVYRSVDSDHSIPQTQTQPFSVPITEPTAESLAINSNVEVKSVTQTEVIAKQLVAEEIKEQHSSISITQQSSLSSSTHLNQTQEVKTELSVEKSVVLNVFSNLRSNPLPTTNIDNIIGEIISKNSSSSSSSQPIKSTSPSPSPKFAVSPLNDYDYYNSIDDDDTNNQNDYNRYNDNDDDNDRDNKSQQSQEIFDNQELLHNKNDGDDQSVIGNIEFSPPKTNYFEAEISSSNQNTTKNSLTQNNEQNNKNFNDIGRVFNSSESNAFWLPNMNIINNIPIPFENSNHNNNNSDDDHHHHHENHSNSKEKRGRTNSMDSKSSETVYYRAASGSYRQFPEHSDKQNIHNNSKPKVSDISSLSTKIILEVFMKCEITASTLCFDCNIPIGNSLTPKLHSRFCNYFGRWFCKKCHLNKLSVIPSRIVNNWDFSLFKVSEAAIEVMKKFSKDPIIPVEPTIYHLSKRMAKAKEYRLMMKAIAPYIQTCKDSGSLLSHLGGREYLLKDESTYALRDFIAVKQDEFLPMCVKLLTIYTNHLQTCKICQSKGHICHHCNNPQVLFPYQLDKISTCIKCKAVFHKDCAFNKPCPVCLRRDLASKKKEAVNK